MKMRVKRTLDRCSINLLLSARNCKWFFDYFLFVLYFSDKERERLIDMIFQSIGYS